MDKFVTQQDLVFNDSIKVERDFPCLCESLHSDSEIFHDYS